MKPPKAHAAYDTFGGYAVADLKALFGTLHPYGDWKAPIDTYVAKAELDMALAAIEYFTATIASVTIKPTEWGTHRITSPGYRAGPAGP